MSGTSGRGNSMGWRKAWGKCSSSWYGRSMNRIARRGTWKSIYKSFNGTVGSNCKFFKSLESKMSDTVYESSPIWRSCCRSSTWQTTIPSAQVKSVGSDQSVWLDSSRSKSLVKHMVIKLSGYGSSNCSRIVRTGNVSSMSLGYTYCVALGGGAQWATWAFHASSQAAP